jgi:tetratricopeptide (TPR) repeat protein
MNPDMRPITKAAAASALVVMLGACVHTPPGTSVQVALAKKPELVAPAPTPPTVSAAGGPAVEPALPQVDLTSQVGDAFSRGNFCLSVGNDVEAAAAFEEVVKLDPNFTEAWQNLAILHEKAGDSKKAMEAFRRSKQVANR